MGKITEMNNRTKTLSAQDQYDETFHGEYSPEDMEEAVFIEREIQDIPDREEWEPTEEKFQALLAKAKENSLITEKEDAMGMADSQKNQSRREKKIHKTNKITIRKRVMKWSAVVAAVVIGVFGVSMSSEANRAYIMRKVNTMLHDEMKTKINNVDVIESKDGEEIAKEEIESALGVKMPTLFYMPDGMRYKSHSVVLDAQIATIRYSYKEQDICLIALFNAKEAVSILQSDKMSSIEDINSDLTLNLTSDLYEIIENGDSKPTYILQWEHKNVYYELFGKLPKEEMVSIAEKILY